MAARGEVYLPAPLSHDCHGSSRIEPILLPGDCSGTASLVPVTTICYVWPYVEWGGVQVYFLRLAETARGAGFAVRVVMPAQSSPQLRAMFLDRGISVHGFEGCLDLDPATTIGRRVERRLHNGAALAAMLAQLETLARGSPPRPVLHVDVPPWMHPGFWRKLLSHHTAVATMHTALGQVSHARTLLWRRRFARLLAHRRFRLLANSEDVRRSLLRYVRPERLDRIALSRSRIDATEIAAVRTRLEPRETVESRLRLTPTAFRIGILGNMIERKGVLVLLSALEQLAKGGFDIHAVWFTPDPPTPAVREALDGSPVSHRLHWRIARDLGGDPRAALAALAATADLFVLPSLLEGLPIALLEAMALGLPCLTTRVNAIPEAVRHGVNGWLIKPGDAQALAQAIVMLAGDATLRQRLAVAAERDVLATFASPEITRATLDVYRALARA